jgi:major cell surface glycoprotein (TIGR04216 family)
MNTRNKQTRAVILAALMVLSVFAASVAFVGTAAAADRAVAVNGTMFQGEEDFNFSNFDSDPVQLVGSSGNAEGLILSDPISQTQTLGTYENPNNASQTITLAEPKITNFDIKNNAGNDVAGGTYVQGNGAGEVLVEYNFGDAEGITITVEDDTGLDVTSEMVTGSATNTTSDAVTFPITPDTVDVGTYTFTVEGADDLDFGAATQSNTITVTDEVTATLTLSTTEVVQGSNVQFTVTGVEEASDVSVAIDVDDYTGSSTGSDERGEDVFRNVGDVTDRKNDTSNMWAVLEVDDGQAVGSIDTTDLDTDTIAVEVYQGTSPSGDEDDSVDLEVIDGDVSLTGPSGTYVVGSKVDVTGTATEGIDNVAIYARAGGDWELVEISSSNTISVDADGTFDAEDVRLSDGAKGGNDLLSLPGSYRLGVLDASGGTPDSLTTAQFNDNTSATESIVTTTGTLSAEFTTYNGQIDNSYGVLDIDGVDVASAGTDVLVVLIDSRGNNQTTSISVDDDGSFDTDLTLSGLEDGTVGVHVISAGRDGVVGESSTAPGSFTLSSEVRASGTQSQVTADVLSATVDATGSDDQIVSGTFRLSNPQLAITDVSAPVAQGETLTVSGQTNTNPSDNDIIVEIFDADGSSELITSTDDWGTDGAWSVTFDTSALTTGSFSVEAEAGSAADTEEFSVVDEVTTPAPEPEPEPTPEPEPEPEPTEEPAEEETPAETPGFGLLVALTALVAAGFLALRRLD